MHMLEHKDGEILDDGFKSIIFDVNYKVKDEPQVIAFIPNDKVVTDESRFRTDGEDPNAIRGTVYHLLHTQVTPENREKIDASSTLFKQTVMDVLYLTRALCFS
jgi:hypothetical protein